MTEPKTKERLKDSNLGTYSLLDFITATSFKFTNISNVNENYIFTKWSFIFTFNLLVLILIVIFLYVFVVYTFWTYF